MENSSNQKSSSDEMLEELSKEMLKSTGEYSNLWIIKILKAFLILKNSFVFSQRWDWFMCNWL